MTRNRNCVFLLIGVVVFLFVTSVALAIVFFVSFGIKESYKIENNHEYRYRNFFPETEESIVGFVSIQSQLKEDEFITYEQNDGSHVIISPFSLDEYRCTGSCYCGTSFERRTTGSASFPVKGILYLVAALTTFSAIKLSKEYFDEKCVEKLSCEEHEVVRSEVDDCSTMMSVDTNDEKKSNEDSDQVVVKKKKNKFQFFCKGHCIPLDVVDGFELMEKVGAQKGFLTDSDKRLIDLVKQNRESVRQQVIDFGCEKLELEKLVTIDPDQGKAMTQKGLESSAKLLFEEVLHKEFCYGYSLKVELRNNWGRDVLTDLQVCGGTDRRGNPSIVCVTNE